MITQAADPSTYADFAALDAMRHGARAQDPATLRAVARQFESLFARMMIKSMRDAVGTDPIFGSDQQKMYQGMFDDQLSLELTKGRGLGLADMLVRQLQRMAGDGAQAPGSTLPSAGAAGTSQTAAVPAAPNAPSAGTSAAPGSAGGAPATAAERERFVGSLWTEAQSAGRELGVDPRALIAQAALETGWGRHMPQAADGTPSNNLFGIKAGAGTTDAVNAPTVEYRAGRPQVTTAAFRAYDGAAQSFRDYVGLLRGSARYAAALNTGSDVQAFATALQQGGYATDPQYARKLSAMAGAVADTVAGSLARPPGLKFAQNGPIASTRYL